MYNVLIILSLFINFIVQFSIVTFVGATEISDSIYFGQSIASLIGAVFANSLGMYLIKQVSIVDINCHYLCLKYVKNKVYKLAILMWAVTIIVMYFIFNYKQFELISIISFTFIFVISSTISTSYLRYRENFIIIEVVNIVVSSIYLLFVFIQSKFKIVDIDFGLFISTVFFVRFFLYAIILQFIVNKHTYAENDFDKDGFNSFIDLYSREFKTLLFSSLYSKSENFIDRFILILMPISGLMSTFHLVQQSYKSATLLYNKAIALRFSIKICQKRVVEIKNIYPKVCKYLLYNLGFIFVSLLAYFLVKNTVIYDLKLNQYQVSKFLDLCALLLPYLFFLLSNQLISNIYFSIGEATFTAKVGVISQTVNYISKFVFVSLFGFTGLLVSLVIHNLTTFSLFILNFKRLEKQK